MNGNFWVIFLSLLIGTVIGFEVGKYVATKKFQDALDKFTSSLKEETEKMKHKLEREDPVQQSKRISEKYGLNDFQTEVYYDPQYELIDPIDRPAEIKLCSNLLVLMMKRGATDQEISWVAKYSMVVLDTEKRRLNWIIARREMKIEPLMLKYGYKEAET